MVVCGHDSPPGYGIEYELADKPKSDLYLELVAAVNSAIVEVRDVPELQRQLRSQERRRGFRT